MKKIILFMFCASTLFLTACDTKKPIEFTHTEETESVGSALEDMRYKYALALGEAAVAYYLGRSFDASYSQPFYMLEPLGNDNAEIIVEGVEDAVSRALYRVASLAEVIGINESDRSEETSAIEAENVPPDLLGSASSGGGSSNDSDEADNNEESTVIRAPVGNDENLAYRNEADIMRLDARKQTDISIMKLSTKKQNDTLLSDNDFEKVFFPSRTAPPIKPKSSSGVVTPEFRSWFLTVAQENGLLDTRLFQKDADWCTYALMCSPSQGGLAFKVFDYTITLTEQELGETTESVKGDAKYDVALESYIHFDNGDYRAVYVTAPSSSTDKVRITVSFSYYEQQGEYETELARFLAGIDALAVVID